MERSHRVGRPRGSGRPRDIIVKFASYRTRRKVYSARNKTKVNGYQGVFINEDITKPRSQLLFKARKMVKSNLLKNAWSSGDNILVRDSTNVKHKLVT